MNRKAVGRLKDRNKRAGRFGVEDSASIYQL
jgi:hypothetical protein